jgi:ABC-type branched-subunit amino acid transport system ATPase component
MSISLLEVRGLARSFGAMRAVDDIGFDVRKGTITG